MDMKTSNLERIVDALAKGDEEFDYFAEIELAPNDIRVEIDTLGQLNFPIQDQIIEKLVEISAKGKVDLGEQIVPDETVRDSQEIKADQLAVSIDENASKNMMAQIRKSLGLGDDVELVHHLYNMLIHGPGQFFKNRRDNEKLEDMVATLVVVLPSPHFGGTLVVEHGKKKCKLCTENIKAVSPKCLAFYADCEHEIEKILEGYRVALTYNVALKAADRMPSPASNLNPALHSAVQSYFDDANREKKQLGFLLQHRYSEHGLKWSLLKGFDRQNVCSFLATAKELNLVPRLALLEINVNFYSHVTEDGTFPDVYDGRFQEARVKVLHCVDADSQKIPNKCLEEDEICWTRENESFEPDRFEDTGYTGNQGRTQDYWYRRAAIILEKC